MYTKPHTVFLKKKEIYSECFLNITQVRFLVCTRDLNYIKRNVIGALDLILVVFEKSNFYLKKKKKKNKQFSHFKDMY